MKKINVVLISCFLSVGIGYTQEFFKADNGKYGLKDKSGNVLIEPKYTSVIEFDEYCHEAIVSSGAKKALIDRKTGKELTPFKYDYIYAEIGNGGANDFYGTNLGGKYSKEDGMTGGKWGMLHPDGTELVPPIYDKVVWEGGIGFIVTLNGKFGFYSEDGRLMSEAKHEEVSPVLWGRICVVSNGGKHVFMKDNQMISRVYDDWSNFSTVEYLGDTWLALVCKDGKCGYIDTLGKEVVSLTFDKAGAFEYGRAAVTKGDQSFCIDKTGKEVLCFDDVKVTWDRKLIVRVGNKYGLFNGDGSSITPIIYDEMKDLEYGLSPVKKDGKWGFVDIRGELVIPMLFDNAQNFDKRGQAKVEQNGREFYIDTKGIETKGIDKEERLKNGYTLVMAGEKFGLYNNGKEVLPPIYDKIDIVAYWKDGFSATKPPYYSNWFYVEIGDKKGVVDENGEVIVPILYRVIKYEGPETADMFYVCEENCGFMDATGKIVVPLVYRYFGDFGDGLAMAMKGDKYGYIDAKGNEVIPFIYEDALRFIDGKARVKLNGAYFYIDRTGKVVN
ncbi:MAG: WG repeat-containing protein [Flavobacteriales bacterium]|nr:WG repeat-containing protein [Flavobacteriales bacterium]